MSATELESKPNTIRLNAQEVLSNPKVVSLIEEAYAKFGDNPAPNVINQVAQNLDNPEAVAMCSYMLIHDGENAIPHLIEALAHSDPHIATFSAKTLPAIDGSLPAVVEVLQQNDLSKLTHAIGCLQGYGVDALPALEAIKAFILKHGSTQLGSLAAGVLERLGKEALPCIQELLQNKDHAIRLVAIAALWTMGPAALTILKTARNRETNEETLLLLCAAISKLETK